MRKDDTCMCRYYSIMSTLIGVYLEWRLLFHSAMYIAHVRPFAIRSPNRWLRIIVARLTEPPTPQSPCFCFPLHRPLYFFRLGQISNSRTVTAIPNFVLDVTRCFSCYTRNVQTLLLWIFFCGNCTNGRGYRFCTFYSDWFFRTFRHVSWTYIRNVDLTPVKNKVNQLSYN